MRFADQDRLACLAWLQEALARERYPLVPCEWAHVSRVSRDPLRYDKVIDEA